ncbi:hypothetical protein [Ramlibacter algicola]|uniref:Lipoprotein n=1 Tax=Ramlibacter algicola TaxID=2795217 RepID=A0A934Q028_9BURK|nr:hypothetical protein [Ramlibacter algicola]MBK0393740.1 hypothetical protein [Ramlibacter algicola]
MKEASIAGLALASLLGGGCSVYPVEPKYNEAKLVDTGSGKNLAPLSVLGSAHLISGWRAALESAAGDRQAAKVATSEILFYGTLLAFAGTAGGFHHAHQVRNVGAAAVGGSSLFTSHYQPELQLTAFRKAADRLECAERAVAPMAVAREDVLFSPTELATMADKIDRVPEQTRSFIAKQRAELATSLQAIKLEPPTKEQLESLVDRSRAAEARASTAARTLLTTSTDKPANVQSRIGALAKIDPKDKEAMAKQLNFSDSELAYKKTQYLVALEKYPTALEFCLANQPQ